MQTQALGDTGATVRLTIPAKAEYITLGRLALTGLARARLVPEEALADLKVALSEACSNVVRHAYRDGRDGVVEIRYDLSPDRIAIEVSDEGIGFEGRLEEVDDELSEGGLGIAIIKALSEEFEVGQRADGAGVRLRFVKRLAA